MKKYRIFTRTFYKKNNNKDISGFFIWENGVEPSMGNKKTITYAKTKEEARQKCLDYNNSHNPGKFSRKAEFE